MHNGVDGKREIRDNRSDTGNLTLQKLSMQPIKRSLILLAVAAFAVTGFAQTSTNTPAPPISPATNSINFWQGLEIFGSTLGSSMPTNFVVSPYMSYAPSLKQKVGGGIFAGWNISQNVGVGAAFDYAGGQATMFSGQVTLKVPTRPLTFLSSSLSNVVVTPYALGGIGTPISGVGDANGSLAAIAGAGAAVDFCEVLGGGTRRDGGGGGLVQLRHDGGHAVLPRPDLAQGVLRGNAETLKR